MKIKPRHPEKVNKPINPIKKKPNWIRSKIVDSQVFFQTKQVVNQNNLVTVCQEANCPNITECWSKKHATFMIMGDTCTRACAFCDVKTGKPLALDIFEPAKIAEAVKNLNMKLLIFFKTKKLLLLNILLTFYIATNLVGGERGLVSFYEKERIYKHLIQKEKKTFKLIN